MKQSQDPFEAAFVEQDESPPESPSAPNDNENQTIATPVTDANQAEDEAGLDDVANPNVTSTSAAPPASARSTQPSNKNKDEDEDEEEDNMDVELGKLPSSGDPDKMAMMQYVFFNALFQQTFATVCMFQLKFSISIAAILIR